MEFGTRQNKTYLSIKIDAVTDVEHMSEKNMGKKLAMIVIKRQNSEEVQYPDMTASIKSITYVEKTVPWQKEVYKSYEVEFDSEYICNFKQDSSYTLSFFNALCSLDELSGKFYIRPYITKTKAADGSEVDRLRLYIEYNGQKIDWKYKPEEIPQLKPFTVKGKTYYDDDERMAWLKERYAEVNAKLGNRGSENGNQPKTNGTAKDPWEETGNNDEELDAIFGGAEKA